MTITMLSSTMNMIVSRGAAAATKRTGRRFFVEAFTSPSRRITLNTRTTSRNPPSSSASARIAPTISAAHSVVHYRRSKSSTTSRGAASIDEDLDAALDELLGSSADEEETLSVATKPAAKAHDDKLMVNHIEGSKPVPQALVEEVSEPGGSCNMKRLQGRESLPLKMFS